MLNRKLYAKILESVPVLTVDILIKKQNKYLLVKRTNRPLKGVYFVPGGRIFRGESMVQAAKRKTFEETGLRVKKIKFVGYMNGIFKDNMYNLDYIQTVSLVFQCDAFSGKIRLDKQGSEYKWSDKLPKQFKLNK